MAVHSAAECGLSERQQSVALILTTHPKQIIRPLTYVIQLLSLMGAREVEEKCKKPWGRPE